MKSPLLSICIATHNRADYIGETLDSIIPQLTDEVEIVVVDGASTDATQEVLERYAAVCPGLRYIRLLEKGGVDQDYCKAVEHACGEYCWLFPDDDLFKPGAIPRVLSELRKGHSLVIVNSIVMDRRLTTVLDPRMFPNRVDEIYGPDELEGLFRRVIPGISFIGCVVIRRQTWLERERARYFGTEFVHVGVIFQRPLPGSACVIADPCVTIRYGNAQWTSRSFEVWMRKWPGIIWSFDRIPSEEKRRRVKPEPWRRLKTLRFWRATGSYSKDMYEKIIAPSNTSRPWKLAALAISLFPLPAFNSYMLWYHKTFKKHKVMAIYDLSVGRENLLRLSG